MAQFSIAVPFRTNYYECYAKILESAGLLRQCLMWTRRPMPGVPKDKNRLLPVLGLTAYATAKTLPPYYSEAARFAQYPLFDQWAKRHLYAGEYILSSYAYANSCFKWVKAHAGKTFLDGGNSHPENFWEILAAEHQRWSCKYPPVPEFYIDRARRMMEDVDYILSPSDYVSDSFQSRGFRADQIIKVTYPVDLSLFKPPAGQLPRTRATDAPFTLINTGSLSLRKGTPYLLEAFRLIHRQIPNSKLLLTEIVTDSIKPVLRDYADLPIEWSPPLAHDQLVERLHSADLFILPSLEEGLVRTALEAMACGLPVILTPNTGAAQFVEEGINGSVVPIRDPQAIADQALDWREKLAADHIVPIIDFSEKLAFDSLSESLISQLQDKSLI